MDDYCMAIRIEESPTRGIFPELEPAKSRTKQKMWHKLHRLFGRDDDLSPSQSPNPRANQFGQNQQPPANHLGDNQESPRRDFGRRVGVGLPRPATFRRQNSEKRERLEPIQPCLSERRAVSAHRHHRAASAYRPRSSSSPSPRIPSQVSAPSLTLSNSTSDQLASTNQAFLPRDSTERINFNNGKAKESTNPCRSPSRSSSDRFDELARDEKQQIDQELETKWILNLSMHFRDKSDREKFFITFAEKPNRWRRVTISCDYRNAEPDSLETDLKELQYQRDKNAQIYESIRDSLPSIQFYNTVTNLKLETENGRLHVHVTEDVNEIIPYPPRLSVQHVLSDRTNPVREALESQISFLSHLSGFVYKVGFAGREYIKKEIPGPDTVDEFLYEVNALHALSSSTCVIKLEAIVLDDSRQTVKGLLISYAVRGALVDLLYDHKGNLPWADRIRWARQAIQGLSEIHEEGYVQGDFTLSNIVINNENDAKIIDINRRGCPVGWEPPEIADKIASNQRISMYIGQKSDLYQLGMTLWALAMDEDEPERHDQPLCMAHIPDEVPNWFKEIVNICLSPKPRDRLSAKDLLRLFPLLPSDHIPHEITKLVDVVDDRSPKRYIEPCAAVEREDLERLGRRRRRSTSEGPSTEDASFIDPPSSSYQFDSGSSFVGIRRGRQPPLQSDAADDRDSAHMRSEECNLDALDETDLSPRIISVSPGRRPRYEGFDSDANIDQQLRSFVLPEDSTQPENSIPPENQSSEQPRQSDEQLTECGHVASVGTIAPTQQEPEAQTPDADLELPSPHQSPADATVSITSESTPRNAPSVLATSTSSMVPPCTLDLATADLACFGSHPTLEEYSPHEPMKCPDIQSSQYYDTHSQQQNFADSIDVTSHANEPHLPDVATQPPSQAISPGIVDATTALEPGASVLLPTSGNEEKQSLPIPP